MANWRPPIPGNTTSVKLTANVFAGNGTALIGGGVANGAIVQQGNVTSSAGNFSGADNIATPNFWPNATLQAQSVLSSVLDAGYGSDAPRPMTVRSLVNAASRAGALQSAP